MSICEVCIVAGQQRQLCRHVKVWLWLRHIFLQVFREMVSYICEDGRIWKYRTEGGNILSGCDGHL